MRRWVPLILLLLLVQACAQAKVWRVRQGGTIGTDCEATAFLEIGVWGNNIRPGDEVWVYPGTYGPVAIPYSNTIWKAKDAAGKDVVPAFGVKNPVVIDAQGTGWGINIGGGIHGVTLQGFEVKGAVNKGWGNAGIWLTCGGATIQQCLVHDCGPYGIFVSNGAKGNRILRCAVYGAIAESGMQECGNNRYEENRLFGDRVQVADVDNGAFIQGNICLDAAGEPIMPKLWGNFYATASGIKGYYDLTGYGQAEPLILVIEVFDSHDKPIARGEAPVAAGKGSLWLRTPGLAEGAHRVVLALKSADGKKTVVTSRLPFTWTKYPWVGNRIGMNDLVIPPFEPIRVFNEELSIWGRTFTIAPTGLPAQIRNQDTPLLTAPIALNAIIGGKAVALTPAADKPVKRLNERKANRVNFTGAAQLGQIPVEVSTFLEYDGWYQVRLAFGNAQPVTVDALELTIPLWKGADTLTAERTEARYGYDNLVYAGFPLGGESYYGAIPPGEGVVWDSGKMPGGFAPSVYAGSGDVGLWWYTEDPVTADEMAQPGYPDKVSGWSFDAGHPAITVERSPGGVVLHLRIAAIPKELPPGYVFEFALLPQPVKPMIPEWRRYAWCHRGGNPPDRYGHDTAGFRYYGGSLDGFDMDEEELAALKEAFETESGHPKSGFFPSTTSYPYIRGLPMTLYGSGREAGMGLDAFDVYGGEWLDNTRWQPAPREQPSSKFSYAGIPYDTPRKMSVAWVNFNRSFLECFLWHHRQIIDTLGVNGMYWDNAGQMKIWDIDPATGKRIWKWDTFQRRELCKRLAVMGWELGREPWWIIHDQPMDFSWVQEDWHVEGNMYVPRKGMDELDWMPPAHFRALTRSKGGPYHKVWIRIPDAEDPATSPERKSAVWRSLAALLLTHDIGDYNHWNTMPHPEWFEDAVDFFNEKDCEFIGYWRTGEMAKFAPVQDVYISAYRNLKRKRVLLVLMYAAPGTFPKEQKPPPDDPDAENGKDIEPAPKLPQPITGMLTINPEKLFGMRVTVQKVFDLEGPFDVTLPSKGENAYPDIEIKHHDYRALVVEVE